MIRIINLTIFCFQIKPFQMCTYCAKNLKKGIISIKYSFTLSKSNTIPIVFLDVAKNYFDQVEITHVQRIA